TNAYRHRGGINGCEGGTHGSEKILTANSAPIFQKSLFSVTLRPPSMFCRPHKGNVFSNYWLISL
ncbi:hypothetical protein S245_015943, partial [Arachis hypogaea]